ncbi:MAG: hypothetical protein LBS74_09265 [Oscillospiraceae bacterium]|jgi:hypothetical protein|nr:hypothetical protein [Oscillospiraceae bacterium]
MKNTFKKGLPLLLALLVMLTAVVGCAKTKETASSSSSQQTESTAIIDDGEGDGGDGGNENGNPDNPIGDDNVSTERNEAIIKAFTPKGETIAEGTDIPGSFIIYSKKNLEELVAFYQKALDGLGAVKTTINDSVSGAWTYIGTYGGTKIIMVEIRQDADQSVVAVTY